jgi:hypothetical protein
MGKYRMKKRVIVVLGMHRSGTSVLSAALECLGVEFGDFLLGPRDDNPKGFWEDRDVVELNERLHALAGSLSSSLGFDVECLLDASEYPCVRQELAELLEARLGSHARFGIKDPRMSRLMDVWLPVLEELGVETAFVLPLRNPLSVAASLSRRDAFPVIKSLLLWYEHSYRALRFACSRRMLVVDYDGFMDRPRDALLRIAERLGLGFDEQAYARFSERILADELRHSQFDEAALRVHEGGFPALLGLHDLLDRLARDEVRPGDGRFESLLQAVERDFSGLWPLMRHCGKQDVEMWEGGEYLRREKSYFVAREAELGGWIASLESTVQTGESLRLKEQGWFRQQLDEWQGHAQLLEGRLASTTDELSEAYRQAASARQQVEMARQENMAVHRELQALYGSSSWRVTAPLRWARRLFERHRRMLFD